MNTLNKRLHTLEQAAAPQIHRSMNDTERAVRLNALLQPGHPRNETARTLLNQLCPVPCEKVAEG